MVMHTKKLEETVKLLLRIQYPEIYKTHVANKPKEDKVENLVLYYLSKQFDYTVSLHINNITTEKYFNFSCRIRDKTNTKKTVDIKIPYTQVLHRLYIDITTKRLKEYINTQLQERSLQINA